MEDKHYLRTASGRRFGPVSFATLQTWARDGRVEPTSCVSDDLENWIPAPNIPDLGMEWVVENNPGQFYGPTHRAVIDEFFRSGTLVPTARFYRDMRSGLIEKAAWEAERAAWETEKATWETEKGTWTKAQDEWNKTKSELEKAKLELEKAKAESEKSKSELEKSKSELEKDKAEAERRQAAWATEKAALDGEKKAAEAARDNAQAEVAKLKAEIEALKNPPVAEEVLMPEVIVSDAPPPSKAQQAFSRPVAAPAAPAAAKSSPFGGRITSLADLERQAQAELARMRAQGGGGFFGFGRKK